MSKIKAKGITLEEYLKPFSLTCGCCGGEAIAYPCPTPKGAIFCPKCSPAWLKSFLDFLTNKEIRGQKYDTHQVI